MLYSIIFTIVFVWFVAGLFIARYGYWTDRISSSDIWPVVLAWPLIFAAFGIEKVNDWLFHNFFSKPED